MTFAEWIKAQIEALRAMISSDDTPDPARPGDDVVRETRSNDTLTWHFFSNPSNLSRVRKSIERFCGECSLDTPACDEIGLVVNEALANVIRHAYGNAKDKPIEMRAARLERGVRISIRDWGNGIIPMTDSSVEKDPLVPGGLGLICMRHLMNDMHFTPEPDGMLLVMTRTTPGSKAATVDETDRNNP